MKCQAVHQWLLDSDKPKQLTASLSKHLEGCLSCRTWRQRLINLESHVRLLPTPPSTAKAAFLSQFLAGAEISGARAELVNLLPAANGDDRPSVEVPPDSDGHRSTLKARVLRLAGVVGTTLRAPHLAVRAIPAATRRRLAAALAASLLLMAMGMWAKYGPHGPLNPDSGSGRMDPFLAQLLQRDLKLAGARTQRERVETLANLADDLQVRTQMVAEVADAEDLIALAALYEGVVEKGLLPQARGLTPADKDRVIPDVAGRLDRAATRVEQLARDKPNVSAAPLHTIANAARSGQRELHDLLGG
jgi:hypothetical protein